MKFLRGAGLDTIESVSDQAAYLFQLLCTRKMEKWCLAQRNYLSNIPERNTSFRHYVKVGLSVARQDDLPLFPSDPENGGAVL